MGAKRETERKRENTMGMRAVCACVLRFKGSLSFKDLKKHPWAPETLLGNDTFGCWAEVRIFVGGYGTYVLHCILHILLPRLKG